MSKGEKSQVGKCLWCILESYNYFCILMSY